MNFDATIHTAVQIQADQDPIRLEVARQLQEATPAAAHRSRLAWHAGKWLSRAGRWLQGLPGTVESPGSPG